MAYLFKSTHVLETVKVGGFTKLKGQKASHARYLFAVVWFCGVLLWISVNIALGHSHVVSGMIF
jgi:hypothetical protein